MSAAFETARNFAEHGYPVFPVNGKLPLTPHGFKDATTDEQQLLHWHERHPAANWALACGDRVSVVDVDSKAGADPREIIDEHELTGPIVWTGEATDGPLEGIRGAHVFCAAGTPTGNGRVAGVEVRGAGSYVVLPGSRHPSGVTYQWDDDKRPWSTPLTPVPTALAPTKARSGRAATVSLAIGAGARNNSLLSLGGTMRRRGMSEKAIAAALLVENRDRCEPPLDDDEVREVARSVARYEPAETVLSAVDELTALLALDAVGRRVDTVRVFGRGGTAVAHIHLDDGERIVLDPIGRFGTTAKLAQEVALQAGAEPAFKPADVTRVMALLYHLADHVAAFEVEDRARDHGSNYLRETPVEAVDMTDQTDRWRAFSLLARANALGGPPRHVLEDVTTGNRFVRIGWFIAYVRDATGPGEAEAVLAALTRIGWSKPGGRGRVKASQPKGTGSLLWTFCVVPPRWEDE